MNPDSTENLRRNEFGDLRSRFRRAINLTIIGGADFYERKRHLPRLISYDSTHESREAASETLSIIRRLYGAIRHERRLGKQGHWAYDLNRHIGLRQALRAELAFLRKLKRPHST